MINILCSRICVLACGTLYPGYASFKTVRAKAVNDYVKWMMYWIVFAIFTATEAFTDIFLTWFPLYYEIKVILILWLLPTIGNGSAFIYKNWVHPLLKKNETRVDHQLDQFREKGQELVLHYTKEAATYIGSNVMKVVNKNFPSAILGVLTTNDGAKNLQLSSNINSREEHVKNIPIKSTSKLLSNASNKNMNAEESHTSRRRGRSARKSKQDLD